MAAGEGAGPGGSTSQEQEGDRAQVDRGYQAGITRGAPWLTTFTARMIALNNTWSKASRQ
jgi:hypothetical protein